MCNWSKVLLLPMVIILSISLTQAQRRPGDLPVQYMVKYVCGFAAPQPAGEEPPVKPGNYATAINIHNHTMQTVQGSRQVAIHYRSGTSIPPVPPFKAFNLVNRRVLEIDCTDIWQMVGVPPSTFIKGMVHIGLPLEYPVAAVYTSQTDIDTQTPGPDAGAGISIDVEYVKPFIEPTP